MLKITRTQNKTIAVKRMNKLYGVLMGMALVLLLTGAALASTNNTSTSSMTEIHVFDKNSTVKPSPVLSYTPTAINTTTAVSWSNMTAGIWQAIFSDILRALAVAISILASLTSVVSLLLLVYNKRNANKKRRDERRSFVETGIIKINNEFEPVTICTGNYDFKLNGYTVSLKTGESLIIPQPLPDPDYFEYLMIAGWGFAKKDGEPMGNMKSKEELGTVTFLKDDQVKAGKTIKIVQPEWSSLGNPDCIKFLDANPDRAYGDDPSVEEIRKKGIVGKVKSDYTNIHTHWIDLNIYVNILGIPEGAKHIKISLTKPNRTYISLNIAEIIPVTKKEYGKIKKALEKEIQSEAIKNGELKKILELYQRLRNEQKPTDEDKGKLWSSADEYIEKKDIYTAYKLIKYALILENNLKGRY